jgi:hypothetical protein
MTNNSMTQFLSFRGTILTAAVLVALTTAAFAADVTGTVTNKTSNKPAAGDDVVLLALSQGMNEAGRTKTDASGKFSFKNVDSSSPFLVRVIHQGVTYHAQLPPGRSSADVDVYDVAKKIDNLSATVQVMRIQGDSKALQVTELYAVNNASNPPKTLMADETFNIMLPDGAQIDGGEAVSGKNGMPVSSSPVPAKDKNHYFFIFPLRPGETRFQVTYHVPYNGEIALNEKVLYPMEHFVVMLPKAMQFSPGNPAQFQSMGPDQGGDPGSTTMVSTSVKPGDTLAFKVSGSGAFPAENEQQSAEAGGGAPDSRPGGGLGPPSEAPDPLHKYRWYILSALVVAMAAGAFYVLSKRPELPAEAAATVPTPAPASRPARAAAPAAASNGRSSMLLEALKEELFQLEVDRQEGRISEADYNKAKTALDITIGRAIKRGSPVSKTQGA